MENLASVRGRGRRGEDRSAAPLRIAIVGTPRSGNTWLRHMLDHVYRFSDHSLGELPLYDPMAAPWPSLPDRCIVMTHWPRSPELVEQLDAHDFRVVTLARHPLDVLISILQYAPCGGSLRWLEGAWGDERSIVGASPAAPTFLNYATSPRARALLSVSPQWWQAPGVLRIRYEDMVRDPRGMLSQLVGALSKVEDALVEEAVEACTIERLRNPETARHFWQGRPGLWKRLLTAHEARRIAAAHADIFRELNYLCDPDSLLTSDRALALWKLLCPNVFSAAS